MPFKLFFEGEQTASKWPLPDSAEEAILEEMKKPQNKRLYRFGVDFSAVEKVEHYS